MKNLKKPLIIAGHGIRLSGAIKEFDELIEKTSEPHMLPIYQKIIEKIKKN